jgi:Zn-finger domain-containing protein
MEHDYLTDYEKLCLNESADKIKKRYPLIPLIQIKEDLEVLKALKTPWERTKFRRFLRSISSFVYKEKD